MSLRRVFHLGLHILLSAPSLRHRRQRERLARWLRLTADVLENAAPGEVWETIARRQEVSAVDRLRRLWAIGFRVQPRRRVTVGGSE